MRLKSPSDAVGDDRVGVGAGAGAGVAQGAGVCVEASVGVLAISNWF